MEWKNRKSRGPTSKGRDEKGRKTGGERKGGEGDLIRPDYVQHLTYDTVSGT